MSERNRELVNLVIVAILTGLGFGILVIGGSLRGRGLVEQSGKRTSEAAGTKAIPAV